jgi:hypothetical protein
VGKESKRGGGRTSLVDITNRRSTSLGGRWCRSRNRRWPACRGWALCLPSQRGKRSASWARAFKVCEAQAFCLDSQPNLRQKGKASARFEQLFLCASPVSSALGAMTLADSLGPSRCSSPLTPSVPARDSARFRCERSHAAIVAQNGVTSVGDDQCAQWIL